MTRNHNSPSPSHRPDSHRIGAFPFTFACAALVLSCQSILGLDDYGFAPTTSPDAAVGQGGDGGSAGSGGEAPCSAGEPGCGGGGSGGARTCEPTARRCADNTPQACTVDGSAWEDLASRCSGSTPACLEPAAECGTCTSDQRQCDDNVPQRCEAGAWVDEAACSGETPQCYTGGACGCAHGAARCTSSGDRELCVNGSWTSEACSVPCSGEPGSAACGRVTQITAGEDHTCAVLSTGAVRCWGEGAGSIQNGGQLGYGSAEDVGTGAGMYSTVASGPAAVFAFSDPEVVEQIAAGGDHTCIRRSAGLVQCWGDNGVGQLGLGHTAPFSAMSPDIDFDADPSLNETASQIAVGRSHSCAITSTPSTGGVRCWGENNLGQLGTNTTEDVGCGGDCGLSAEVSSGFVVYFGDNQRAEQIAAGAEHTCAILSTGGTRCWGSANYGQLGQGDTLPIGDGTRYVDAVPDVAFGPGLSALQISAGAFHTCAVLTGGVVRCWGRGELGRLGNGGEDNVGGGEPSVFPTVAAAPNVNLGGATAMKVAAGGSHTCVLLSTGAVRCWGEGAAGRLGIGAAPASLAVGTGADVDFGDGITATDVAAGASHTCAILSTGGVRCWGLNSSGQLGYGHLDNVGDDESPSTDVQFF